MARPRNLLTSEARRVLGFGSQTELAEALGYSRRTGQRWIAHGGPDSWVMQSLAKLVFPVDTELAEEIAASAGVTMQMLGLARPPPPPAPVPPAPPPPPPRPVLPARVVDAVVCAAAEATASTPQQARPAVLAAFACAEELGLAVEDVTRALRRTPPQS